MKERLTVLEKRAASACNNIKDWGNGDFTIEWRRSRTWGRVAVVVANGEKCSEASGCGYDKESSALAQFLIFLCPSVSGFGGTGLGSVKAACLKDGWKLSTVASGKIFDAYHIEREVTL